MRGGSMTTEPSNEGIDRVLIRLQDRECRHE